MTRPRSGRFSIIPAAAVFDHRLSHGAVRVLAALGSHADRQGRCWPSAATLAHEIGMCERHVRRCCQELERLGHLDTEARQGQSSIYRIPRTQIAGVAPSTPAMARPGSSSA